MKYIAHSENKAGSLHSLKEHLYCTSAIAKKFAISSWIKEMCRLAGLVHDFGKYSMEFQCYLKNGGRRGSVPHSFWGAVFLKNIMHQSDDCGYKELSFCVNGHHGGLPNRSKWEKEDTSLSEEDKAEYSEITKVFLKDLNPGAEELLLKTPEFKNCSPLEKELITRFIFSCLTDADWLDTERHFDPEKSGARIKNSPDIKMLLNKLDRFFKTLSARGEINKLRNEVRNYACGKAERPPGFFSLNLPTGMGKTYTSLYWALKHARFNDLKRIIIVLPFVNIIDQTAQILKERFGEDVVLEHHSGVSETDDPDEKYNRRKLACENWDYPIIITTTVQFFESLFSNKTSRCRKIHNIAESVVIFDEVQSLPKNIILPTLTLLKNFQNVFKTSFLFCTATLPAFQKRNKFDGIESIEPLAKNPEELFKATKRVEYRALNDFVTITFSHLTGLVKETAASSLLIFNTKKDAYRFYTGAVKELTGWDRIYHLSTNMCPDHRKRIINSIKTDLSAKKKIIVTSTQLVEAGVDLDFPYVFRAMAPLESVIQSAGRCNREGLLGSPGVVSLFQLEGNSMPGDKTYSAGTEHAKCLIRENINRLEDHRFYEEYYRQMITLFVDPDSKKINSEREKYNFKEVAERYHIIETKTESLFIVEYNEDSKRLYKSLEFKDFLSRKDYRKMQMYSVQVYPDFQRSNNAFIEQRPQGFKIWEGVYSETTGISIQSVEDLNFIC